MAQERHLTIEQLSAFLDGQLSQQERAECDVHLQRCQQCQSLLADLRHTVNILHTLPQPELPRSFVLPAPATLTAARTQRQDTPVMSIIQGRGRSWQTYLQRSTRIISTIAAVLGIFFIVSSLFSAGLTLPHGGASSTASAPALSSAPNLSSQAAGTSATVVPAPPPNLAGSGQKPPRAAPTDQMEAYAPTSGPAPRPTPRSTSTGAPTTTSAPPPQTFSSNGSHAYAQTPSVPAILDLSTLEGRAGVGAILLILGILGVFFTRRRRAGGW